MKIREVSSQTPNVKLSASTIGIPINISLRVCSEVTLPVGNGLHGLFARSSSTDSGSLWFAKSKIKTFDQLKRITRGSRWSNFVLDGLSWVVRQRPELAPRMPKAVFGTTNVGKLLSVYSHRRHGRSFTLIILLCLEKSVVILCQVCGRHPQPLILVLVFPSLLQISILRKDC